MDTTSRSSQSTNNLPPIPAKRYFTIGEVSELCGVKPHVLRYWEQEFTQLKPVKRRGNRRYYQHHEVLLIRRIRELLYEQGFTISGARNRLAESGGAGGSRHAAAKGALPAPGEGTDVVEDDLPHDQPAASSASNAAAPPPNSPSLPALPLERMREELLLLREMLAP